jgi:hypothetical protein
VQGIRPQAPEYVCEFGPLVGWEDANSDKFPVDFPPVKKTKESAKLVSSMFRSIA